MFRQIFGSKLQHPDPELRLQAIEEVELDDPRLAELALGDDDAAVRRAALGKISALEPLTQAVEKEQDAATRTAARGRLVEVLCGEAGAQDLQDARQRALALVSDEAALLEQVLSQARDVDLRSAALERVDSQPLLAKIATSDPAGQLRAAALERVVEESLLEEIARSARNRDKGVARLARERAEAARVVRERAEEADRLCAEIERLAGSGLDAVDTAAYLKLDQEWEQWSSGAETDFADARQRYAKARERIQGRLTGRAEARRRGDEILARLDPAAAPAEDTADSLDLTALRGEWEQLSANAGSQYELPVFDAAVDRLREAQARAREDQERVGALDAWLATQEGAGEDESSADVDALTSEWEALDKPSDATLLEPLRQRFQRLRAPLDSKATDGAEQATEDTSEAQGAKKSGGGRAPLDEAQLTERLAQLNKRLDEADGHIASGELKPATAAFDAARAVSEQLGKARGNAAIRAARERLGATGPKLNELRSWRRWSTDRARERLCDEVEQLLAGEEDPTALARKIRAYRESWKKLDKAEGGAAKSLWERFNTACTKAYEPCRKHFSAEADQRNQNLARKVALVEGLEALAADTDWEGEVDWRALDKAMGQFRRDWRAVGPVNRRDNKGLMDRHDKVRAQLDEQLGPVRERELERRREAVAQLTALAEREDLRGAADKAKRAQAEWTPLVRGPRKVEQALWTDFRAACDRIFERLREQREVAQGARNDALKQCEQACEQIETLTGELSALGFRAEDRAKEQDLAQRFAQARGEYAGGGEVPRAKEGALKSRYRKACDAFEAAQRQRRESRQLRGLSALAQRAAIAAQLEQAVVAEASDAAEQADRLSTEWEALEPTQDKALDQVVARYERALAGARGDAAAAADLTQSLAKTLEEREQLCLELEIATGVESPAHLKAQRMAFQIDRLQASLSGTDKPSKAQIEALLRRWYALGPVPEQARAALDERFSRVSAAALGSKRAQS